jgi:hypothetical protein
MHKKWQFWKVGGKSELDFNTEEDFRIDSFRKGLFFVVYAIFAFFVLVGIQALVFYTYKDMKRIDRDTWTCERYVDNRCVSMTREL